MKAPTLRLTEAHVARATRIVDGPRYRDDWHMLEDDELDQLAG